MDQNEPSKNQDFESIQKSIEEIRESLKTLKVSYKKSKRRDSIASEIDDREMTLFQFRLSKNWRCSKIE